MAIIDGKRVLGLQFWKVRGRSEWMATHYIPKFSDNRGVTFLYSTPVLVDTKDDPRKLRWRYCSIVAQPVFIEVTEFGGGHPHNSYPVSFAKIPEGWQAALRDALTGSGALPAKNGEGDKGNK